jgi:hypothetical protein
MLAPPPTNDCGSRTLLRRLVQRLRAYDQLLKHFILLVLLQQLCALGLNVGALVALGFFKGVDVLCELVGKLLEGTLDEQRVLGARHRDWRVWLCLE